MQSDSRYGLTLALTGSSYGETGSRKATYLRAGRNIKNLDFTGELIPAASPFYSGKSPGNPVVELTTPNGTTPHATTGGTPATQWLINLSEGTNKNELWV
ncbi:MAG: hypothetical protein RMY64_14005 [Nostoc sp. DedQUE08]|uniref:hypothetical protein n=1 Tax=unclassified Nostoc TaxID=2593658 RepID=UPI002AD25603|nr:MULTISPECIES: hypothetical protein [unclassified Nostoc]MDZ8066712.1 hypothetical protein [Nostoc sp. DedQUE08]MDZ8093472.1 hypothetical protein [Nostoc sp. DedQUE05]